MANDLIFRLYFFGPDAAANARAAQAVREAFGRDDDAMATMDDGQTVALECDGLVGRIGPYSAVRSAVESAGCVCVLGTSFELQNSFLDAFLINQSERASVSLLGSSERWPVRRALRALVDSLGDVPAYLADLVVDDALVTHRGTYRAYIGGWRDLPNVFRHLATTLVAWPWWIPGLLRAARTVGPYREGYRPEVVLLATGGLSERHLPPNGYHAPARSAFGVDADEALAVWRPEWPVSATGVLLLVLACLVNALAHVGSVLVVARIRDWLRSYVWRRNVRGNPSTPVADGLTPF